MTHQIRPLDDQDEPALLRDQFRQLLRYRALLAGGVVAGLLGGGFLALSGDETYTAAGEVQVRSATADPFATGASADKGINIGSERQTAVSDTVGDLAAGTLLKKGDDVTARKLLAGLQVTNPPNTLTLRFSYTGAAPEQARARAEALANAYLAHRKARTQESIDNMANGYRAQLDPLEEKRDLLEERTGVDAADDVSSARANIIVSISELSRKISELKALDTTPATSTRSRSRPPSPPVPGCRCSSGWARSSVSLSDCCCPGCASSSTRPSAPRELVRSLGAPLLGTLPRERAAAGTLLAIGRSGSRLAEEYRAVAFRLAYDPSFAERRRLLVTAPRGDNAAASAAAVNLAAAFAEMGRDVLLVEADLRTPSLARDLGPAAHEVRPPSWAAEEGDRTWPAGGRSNVDVPGSGAFALVAGTTADNVPRALTSASVARIVAEADRPGAVVIVLAPPVLSYADAVALVDRVEGVMIVCDPREVHRSDLERIREIISASGGQVLGALLHTGRGRLGRGERRSGAGRRRGGSGPGAPAIEADAPELTRNPDETMGLRSFTLPGARR